MATMWNTMNPMTTTMTSTDEITIPDRKAGYIAQIPGYRLLFKKSMTGAYATIEQDANWSVPAVVYRISTADEIRLDRFEGCPTYYYKRRFALRVRRNNGRKTTELCSAYIMHEDRPLGIPSMFYMRTCREGYDTFGFDRWVLNEAYEKSLEACGDEGL